jgi:hypothetical protein
MASPSTAPRLAPRPTGYRRREPEATALHRALSQHLRTFLAESELADHAGLPGFVRRELLAFLDCGVLARGFARVRCTRCGDDLLVAFSCKGRGFCPSCGGRRMADTAAHLVDRVLPQAPVRQWVLSLPFSLRFAVAFDRELCRQVRSVFTTAVQAALRRRARDRQGVVDGRSGAVVFVQRFGGALNLNVHFHALVLDGVFHQPKSGGAPVFRVGRRLRQGDLADILLTIRVRVAALLRRRGLLDQSAERDLAERSPMLAAAQAASVQGRLAFGPRRGERVTRLGAQASAPMGGPFHRPPRDDCAVDEGFSLHAGPPVPGTDRERLERLCRYLARPAIATERLHGLPDGRIAYELRHPWSDGTTRVVFEPLTFVEKLAALVPPPRAHLVTYHGVLAPAAAWRSAVVPGPSTSRRRGSSGPACRRRYPWAELLRRVFAVDVLRCELCGGRRELIAQITQAGVVRAILTSLGLPTEVPVLHPARGPPALFEVEVPGEALDDGGPEPAAEPW